MRTQIKFILLFAVLVLTSAKTEEGMFPLSELSKIDFKKAGFRISPEQIFNPNAPSIVDAIVRVGGCTGSFISNDGLIITNHHCAFSFVANISDTAHDYIKNGFLAKDKSEEKSASGLVCKITTSYEDVSAKILDGLGDIIDPIERSKKIRQKMADFLDGERKKFPDLQSEISEMFIGRTYVLFRYKLLKDVRLVYVPPRSIGEYGGESDNWVWPRHSGDFAILRAYVGKDGKAADFSKENQPYKPVQFLKVNPNGVNENDLVFILGYPGSTFRHYPAGFYEYHQKYRLPFISSLYDFQINAMEEAGKENRSKQIFFSAKIKSLANVTKNYKGKLQGFNRAGLLERKKAEENELQQWIQQFGPIKAIYGNVIPRLNSIYATIFDDAELNLWVDNVYGASGVLSAAGLVANHRRYMRVLHTDEEKKLYLKQKGAELKNNFAKSYYYYDKEVCKKVTKKLLKDMFLIKDSGKLAKAKKKLKIKKDLDTSIDNWVDEAFEKSILSNAEEAKKLLENNPEKLFTLKDPIIELAFEINDVYNDQDAIDTKRDAELQVLMSKYVEVKQQWKNATFIPDANATLRLTYGYVKGYRPADGTYHKPFTTLRGVMEKEDQDEYALLDLMKELYKSRDFGSYIHPSLGDVPVDFLYNLDTTGGNSGSPVLDADGKLVGVNFDRAYTATINDYAWNENYSRSVGVDIRYVLWVLKKVAKADYLLTEMGA
ncbi:MAG: S46 family peptidase [Bacteroidia bacterium]|nr:S46 family peptidase [Bacteroidia bacterium]